MYVNVKLLHLGKGVREIVFENEDGGHTVFIEEQLAPEAQRKAFLHAMRHIEEDDFGKHGNVGRIEAEAHAAAGGGTCQSPEAPDRGHRLRREIKNPVREHRECQ